MGVGVGGVGGGGGGGGGEAEPTLPANAVFFDGTNDFLLRGGALTGAVDNDTLLLSLWFDLRGDDTTNLRIFDTDLGRFRVRRLTTNLLFFTCKTVTDVAVWQFSTTATFLAAAGWVHLLIAIDAAASKRLVFINDAAVGIQSEISNAGDIDWTLNEWSFGSGLGGVSPVNADMAEVYLTNEFLDIGVEANRRKFIDAAGKPAELGADGSVPTGTKPLLFFRGPTDDWHTNKGSGGGFTESGALTDGASSPSD